MPDNRKFGPYEASDVFSALRKEIKLGDTEAAIYWAVTILTHDPVNGQKAIAKQLWVMAAEDIDDPGIVLRAYAVSRMVGSVPETDHLVFLTAAMCEAPKFWESARGREVDRLWSKAIGDLRDSARNRPMPVYALDSHTAGGWARVREGLNYDDRFSGTDLGRQKTIFLFLRDGVLGPDAQIDGDFWPLWRERQRLEASHLASEESR